MFKHVLYGFQGLAREPHKPISYYSATEFIYGLLLLFVCKIEVFQGHWQILFAFWCESYLKRTDYEKILDDLERLKKPIKPMI
ncbi:MAG TPA: hypothetical protein DCE41_33120 [Cytophagales bacterium]|nr:hypothetical protein [Cytophagales bacterium]HAA19832.1 hypothetical protein [Cytophagales bacterium]HAP63774.1 hypothetical protein [Cytophagales bacterium]